MVMIILIAVTMVHTIICTSPQDREIDQQGGFMSPQGESGRRWFDSMYSNRGMPDSSQYIGGNDPRYSIGRRSGYSVDGSSGPGYSLGGPGGPGYSIGAPGEPGYPDSRMFTARGQGYISRGPGFWYPYTDQGYSSSDQGYGSRGHMGMTRSANMGFGRTLGFGSSFGRWWCTCRKGGCRWGEQRAKNTCQIPFFPWFFQTCCKWLPNFQSSMSMGMSTGYRGFGVMSGKAK